MPKIAKSYYSAAIESYSEPGVFLGSFGIPGKPPEWVMRGAERATFSSPQEAEIAGFRVMMSKLNGTSSVQQVSVKGRPPARKRQEPRRRIDTRLTAEQVFKNFGGTNA